MKDAVKTMSPTSFKVALVGSTGGGSAALSSGESIIENIQKNVNNIVTRKLNLRERSNGHKSSVSFPLVSITEVVFVQSTTGLDFVCKFQPSKSVKLWVMESGGPMVIKWVGSLDDVNTALMIEDTRVAALIHSNEIDALITISSDPLNVNKLAISAAIEKNIPIIGTGGTSLSCISTLGGNVIGCSGGSVATTGITRGICIAASLASYPPWGNLDYSLPKEPILPKFRSVVGAALPILLSVSLLKVALSSYRLLLDYSLIILGEFLLNPLVDKMIRRSAILSQLFIFLARSLLVKIPNTSLTIGEFLEGSFTSWYADLFYSLEQKVLPVAVSAITCMEVCHLEELSLLTGAAAGMTISNKDYFSFTMRLKCFDLS